MKQIPLSQGLFALVDDEDFEELSKYKWNPQKNGERIYAKRPGVNHNTGLRRPVFMHRHILGVTDRAIDVDHIDRNGLNNQKSNLRICTRSFNNANAKIPKDNTSGYKGVYFDKSRGLWHARISKIFLGRFKDKIDAAKAYNEAAKTLWGDFARINEL